MKDLVHKRGADRYYEIASAGTSDEEEGNPVHAGTRRKLAEIGIHTAGKTARQFTRADAAYYDLIVCMDERNVRDARRIAGGAFTDKIVRLLDFAGIDRDVADPWYTGDFDATFSDVEIGCRALFSAEEKNRA